MNPHLKLAVKALSAALILGFQAPSYAADQPIAPDGQNGQETLTPKAKDTAVKAATKEKPKGKKRACKGTKIKHFRSNRAPNIHTDTSQMQVTFQQMKEFLRKIQDFDDLEPNSITWLRKIQKSADQKAYTIKIKFLPNILKDSIRITTYAKTHELQIDGNFREESIQKDVLGKIVGRKVEEGKLTKRFQLPTNSDFSKMETFYKDQDYTLKLRIPKK
jgi:hypothetical protein